MTSEIIWSKMLAARQLSSNYFTILTCLTDILHRYSQTSSVFNNLSQTLFSSSVNQIKLINDYSNILQNILKQNSLHTNILQNIRRLFRSDPYLKQLFTTAIDEYCQCHECDCIISNSITDVIHDIAEIRSRLLIESSQVSCACFRCNDKNQSKTLTFKQFSPCLALTVNRLYVNAKDQLINTEGIVYDLIYIIEFDVTLKLILNVYQRQDAEFVKVDGTDISNRVLTIDSQGKYLTLWISSTTLDNLQSNNNDEDSQLRNSSPATTTSEGTSDTDTVGDIYLTLLHSTNKNHSQIEHDQTINSLASNILWPTIVNQTQRYKENPSSSSSSSTKRSLKQLPTTIKSKRLRPYTTA